MKSLLLSSVILFSSLCYSCGLYDNDEYFKSNQVITVTGTPEGDFTSCSHWNTLVRFPDGTPDTIKVGLDFNTNCLVLTNCFLGLKRCLNRHFIFHKNHKVSDVASLIREEVLHNHVVLGKMRRVPCMQDYVVTYCSRCNKQLSKELLKDFCNNPKEAKLLRHIKSLKVYPKTP